MNREDLKQYVGVTAFSLGHVEKDYFQHIILSALSRKWSSYLVFKGGTALQKIGLIPRFSEDLDFTEEKEISPKMIADTLVRSIERYNFPVKTDRFSDKEITAGFRINIQGPLYRNDRGTCSIRLEVSRREKILLETRVEEINPNYKDVLPYVIRVMDQNEIAAEKVRAILTRDKVRDLYDLFKLIESGAELESEIIEKKLEFYDMTLDISYLVVRCKELAVRWDKDLRSLMEHVPPKKEALDEIVSEIGKIR